MSTNNSNSEFAPNGPYEQVGGESQLILTSQSYLAASSRIEPYKGIAVSMNAIATELTSSVTAVQAATDIDEVNAAYKPSGVINTGRSGASVNDLAPSYFSSLSNMPEGVDQSGLELYVPGTGVVMPYIPTLPSPFKFDSWGDCFVSGDYRLVIRVAATGQVLSTVYPEAGANQNISWTYNPNIPAA